MSGVKNEHSPSLCPPHAQHRVLLTFVVDVQLLVSSVQSLSRVQLFVSPWPAALQASLFITSSQSLLKLMSIKLVMSSPSPPALNLSQHQIFSIESVLCIR